MAKRSKQAGQVVAATDEIRHLNRIYEAFHGEPAQQLLTLEIPYRTIPKHLVTIGEVIAIEYRVVGASRREGENYRHEFGDTGGKQKVHAPVYLCTDHSQRMFYLIPSKGKYPYFSGRGVIG